MFVGNADTASNREAMKDKERAGTQLASHLWSKLVLIVIPQKAMVGSVALRILCSERHTYRQRVVSRSNKPGQWTNG
eukprot:2607752-Amphidinium_carterae.1